MWPMGLVKVARVVDNPFTLAKSRADKAGEVLAEALINKAQGERSVTLIGYSLGARVIYSCLMTLAKKNAFGVVESAILIGAPTPSDTASWRTARSACTGRLVNVYSENDRILAFLYRTSSIQYGIAGLQPVQGLAGVENFDVSETVSGHLRYRFLVGKILQKIGFRDIDPEAIKEEEKAFEKMVEEEKEQDYVRQAKEKSKGFLGKKDVKDEDADKEAKGMEEEVKERNEKSMMQWATEQLYISRADPGKLGGNVGPDQAASMGAKALKSGANAADDALRSGSKSGKTYYQMAKENMYLSRSGSKNEDLAKEGISEVGPGWRTQAMMYVAQYLPGWYGPGGQATGEATGATKGVTGEVDKATGQPKGYVATAASYLPAWHKQKEPAGAGEKVKDAAGTATNAQQAATDKAGQVSGEVADAAGTTVKNATGQVGGATKGVTDTVGSGAQKGFDKVGAPKVVGEKTSEVTDAVGTTGKNAGDTVGKIGTGVSDKTGDALDKGISTAGKAPEQFGKGTAAAGGKVGQVTGADKGVEKVGEGVKGAGKITGADKLGEAPGQVGKGATAVGGVATGAAGQAGGAAKDTVGKAGGAATGAAGKAGGYTSGITGKLGFGGRKVSGAPAPARKPSTNDASKAANDTSKTATDTADKVGEGAKSATKGTGVDKAGEAAAGAAGTGTGYLGRFWGGKKAPASPASKKEGEKKETNGSTPERKASTPKLPRRPSGAPPAPDRRPSGLSERKSSNIGEKKPPLPERKPSTPARTPSSPSIGRTTSGAVSSPMRKASDASKSLPKPPGTEAATGAVSGAGKEAGRRASQAQGVATGAASKAGEGVSGAGKEAGRRASQAQGAATGAASKAGEGVKGVGKATGADKAGEAATGAVGKGGEAVTGAAGKGGEAAMGAAGKGSDAVKGGVGMGSDAVKGGAGKLGEGATGAAGAVGGLGKKTGVGKLWGS